MRFPVKIGLMVVAAGLLAGCGQKGVLYREQATATPTTSQTAAPADPDLNRKPEQEARP